MSSSFIQGKTHQRNIYMHDVMWLSIKQNTSIKKFMFVKHLKINWYW